MAHDVIIEVKALRKSFGEHVVVRDLDLHVNRGEVFGFLGPNGSGKTTTIRMLCGLLVPDSGEGRCLGYNILTQSRQIKQHVGYMTQKYSLYTDLSIEENLNFIANIYQVNQAKQAVTRVMEQLNLRGRSKQLTGELSGGWKQRVALAACLLHDPELLLLDEPTAGIDPIARREFWDTIHALSEQGVTTLMSTHYMDEAERCTRLAYLAYGDLMITGAVNDVIEATKLKTWEIQGKLTTHVLQEIKKIKGVKQAALFGRHIHLSGFDQSEIESGLEELAKSTAITWNVITPTLEDAFISLVEQTQGELG
ncbi:MAG: ABC transporter ATP-binding protein [Legionella sp.]|jgi:ABC-2 type transport system ATP-binding protein|nr:ABC transporter ATP-binding protein [Legionella sp.]